MLWVCLTVICYTCSSLSDKQISASLKCKPEEFAFLVSIATAIWMAVLLLFMGWHMEFSGVSVLFLCFLVICKQIEFYTSAILLKTVSAYELKAWLGMNVVLSYICNIIKGQAEIRLAAVVFCMVLFAGIYMILKAGDNKGKMMLLSVCYCLSKFFYGLVLGMFSEECSSLSILFIVMIVVAVIQLPVVKPHTLFQKKGVSLAVLARIPNALGLITEAYAAVQNIFLYAMVQPMQLLILFIWSVVRKEDISNIKLVGSIASIIAVCMITVVIFL